MSNKTGDKAQSPKPDKKPSSEPSPIREGSQQPAIKRDRTKRNGSEPIVRKPPNQ